MEYVCLHSDVIWIVKDGGATFQRAMDHTFNDMIEKTMEYYQDDLSVHSKIR